MKYGRPVAGAALFVATLVGAMAGALLLGTAGADPGAPAMVTSRSAASPGRCGPVLAAVVDAIGIPADELRAAVDSGQTLAQLAQANGRDPQAVVDAIISAGNARIDHQLSQGVITPEQAALRKATLPGRAADAVNKPLDADRIRNQFSRQVVMARAARSIGVPTTELRTALDQGQSIADVATANGVDPNTVIDDLLAGTTERITAFVNGEALPRSRTGSC